MAACQVVPYIFKCKMTGVHERLMMKIFARVSRGTQLGEIVTPHLHDDGTYVVSYTRFERDYMRVSSLEEFAAKIREGMKGRMSSPNVKGPRLFSSASITIEK